jgi:argininosuccinate lyase
LEQLVLKGVPFREAHHKVGTWVLQCMQKGISLNELLETIPNDFSVKDYDKNFKNNNT